MEEVTIEDAFSEGDRLIVGCDEGNVSIIAVEGGGTDGLPFTAQVDLDIDGVYELRDFLNTFIEDFK
jgi:hypothetical protein